MNKTLEKYRTRDARIRVGSALGVLAGWQLARSSGFRDTTPATVMGGLAGYFLADYFSQPANK
jgi:hypothetical protein